MLAIDHAPRLAKLMHEEKVCATRPYVRDFRAEIAKFEALLKPWRGSFNGCPNYS